MDGPHSIGLYLASPCYGGVAQARFVRSVLDLQTACAARGLPLRLELGGGEALASRGRAAMVASFLKSHASHLVFADSEQAFSPETILERLKAAERSTVQRLEGGLLLMDRAAAEAVTTAYPALAAGLLDVGGATTDATMVFDALIDPETDRYITDLDAFCWRWERLQRSQRDARSG